MLGDNTHILNLAQQVIEESEEGPPPLGQADLPLLLQQDRLQLGVAQSIPLLPRDRLVEVVLPVEVDAVKVISSRAVDASA